jgi:hypothetical protein
MEAAMHLGHFKWPINGDADSELRFWMNALLKALGLGLVFGVATGISIALLPDGEEGSGAEFMQTMWAYLVECAFWLGMFIGLLWSTGRRVGMALAGSLPWQRAEDERRATGRLFGQWAAFAALAGFFLWLFREVAAAAGLQAMALFAGGFSPVVSACWLSAGLFALVAVGSRRWAALKRAPR